MSLRSLRPDVADRGEARAEHVVRIFDRGHAPEAVGEFEPAIPADIGGAVEMDVHVDQAGQQRLVAKVDMFDVRAPAHRARIGNTRDAAVGADEDRRIFDRLSAQHIDVARGGDDRFPRCILCLQRRRGGQEKRGNAKGDSPQKTAELHTGLHI
jgi:hypothetical protein